MLASSDLADSLSAPSAPVHTLCESADVSEDVKVTGSTYIRATFDSTGYDTLVATSGREAASLLEEAEPDLVLCDWKMPGIGGEQSIKR